MRAAEVLPEVLVARRRTTLNSSERSSALTRGSANQPASEMKGWHSQNEKLKSSPTDWAYVVRRQRPIQRETRQKKSSAHDIHTLLYYVTALVDSQPFFRVLCPLARLALHSAGKRTIDRHRRDRQGDGRVGSDWRSARQWGTPVSMRLWRMTDVWKLRLFFTKRVYI